MTHTFPVHVYYEDTDLQGVVYYANYLRYIERARTEWVRALGVDQVALRAKAGIVFAVTRVEADYLSPARFDDDLTVVTALETMTGARLLLSQRVQRGDTVLFRAIVTLVALTERRLGCTPSSRTSPKTRVTASRKVMFFTLMCWISPAKCARREPK